MKKIFTLFLAVLGLLGFQQASAADVTFNVVVPTPTYQVWVVGNFNGWNNNQHQLTKVDDTHYTLTLSESEFADGHTAATLKYKYLSGGGDWAYVEKDAAGAEISDRDYTAGVNDTVQTWANVFNPNVAPIEKDVLVEVWVPTTVVDLYLTGSFNEWKSPGAEGTKMTYNAAESDETGKLFSQTIHTMDANKLAYKFAAGPSWVYEQDSSDLKMPDVTEDAVFHYMHKFKRYYPGDDALKTVTFTVTAPAGTDSVFMMGSHLGWDGASWYPGTKVDATTFSFEFKFDMIEYKYYNGRDYAYEEKQADGSKLESNRAADAQVAITYTDVIAKWSTTGVPTLNMDEYTVYSTNGAVVVNGVKQKVEMFDITGRLVQSANTSGSFTSKTVNSGIYILRVDGATLKVLVN